jgi:hypothetical protein
MRLCELWREDGVHKRGPELGKCNRCCFYGSEFVVLGKVSQQYSPLSLLLLALSFDRGGFQSEKRGAAAAAAELAMVGGRDSE